MCLIPCPILCLADVERMCQCRAPHSPLRIARTDSLGDRFTVQPFTPTATGGSSCNNAQRKTSGLSGVAQRCLNPGFSARIGNSRRTDHYVSVGEGHRRVRSINDAWLSTFVAEGQYRQAASGAAEPPDPGFSERIRQSRDAQDPHADGAIRPCSRRRRRQLDDRMSFGSREQASLRRAQPARSGCVGYRR